MRLKEVLKSKGVSGKELAEKVAVTPASISRIVSGDSFPSAKLLQSIAKALDVDIRELFIPTKEVTGGNLNGFVEYNGEIHRIQNKKDLESLISIINE